MSIRSALSAAYMESHPEAAARSLEQFTAAQVASALTAVSAEVGAEVLRYMAPRPASASLLELPAETATDLLEALPPQTASALLRRLDSDGQERLLDALPANSATAVSRLLRFPERTAGALVDPLVTALPLDVTAAAAVQEVRRFPDRVDHEVFVIDRDHKLMGSIALRALIAAPPDVLLDSLVEPVAARFAALSQATTLVTSPAWADTHTVPVIDDHGVYLGAVRYDTVLRLADDVHGATRTSASVGTLVSLSELCWRGSTHLLSAMLGVVIGGQTVGGARGSR